IPNQSRERLRGIRHSACESLAHLPPPIRLYLVLLHDPRDSVTSLMETSDGPRPKSPCLRAIAYPHLFARSASSQGVVRQTDRVRFDPELPVRIHGSPSCMLRSDDAMEDATEALPPPDFSILLRDEQTTPISPSTGTFLTLLDPLFPVLVLFPLRKD
ncbi:hypothetical protein PIB30_093608, partial [Stylosanthes scabra]|nr:hypothetical protein [Stylosanthes scabra]